MVREGEFSPPGKRIAGHCVSSPGRWRAWSRGNAENSWLVKGCDSLRGRPVCSVDDLDKGCASSARHPVFVTIRVRTGWSGAGVESTPARHRGAHRARWRVHNIVGARTGAHHELHRHRAVAMRRTADIGCAHRIPGMSCTHLRRRRRRASRHGFGRPPGNCRERRQTGGGDVNSAVRSRDASASCWRYSRRSGGRYGGIGATIESSALKGERSPAPSPLPAGPGPGGQSCPGAWHCDFVVRPAGRFPAITAGCPGWGRAVGAAARAPGGAGRPGRRPGPGALGPRWRGGGRRLRG